VSTLDPRTFAQGLVGDLRAALPRAQRGLEDVLALLVAFESDVDATLYEIRAARDPVELAALQADVDLVFPARQAAILSAAESRLSTEAQALFQAAVLTAGKILATVVKSFI